MFPMHDWPSQKCNYSYALKFAFLNTPYYDDLHDQVLDNMDLDKFVPLHFEILCLVAHFKGVKHPVFQKLWQRKPWLMGQYEPAPLSFKLKSNYSCNFKKIE